MRTHAAAAFALLGLLCTPPALAVGVRDVPNPRRVNAWVSDTIDVIDPATEQRLNALLDALERERGFEVAVVTVESVDEPTPKDFATALFNHWGIGKRGLDNGVLVLLVRGARRLEVETGYGVEATLPDGWLRRMQLERMVPRFRAGEFGRGLEAGVLAIEARLREGGEPPDEALAPAGRPTLGAVGGPSPREPDHGRPVWLYLLGGLGLAFVGGGAYPFRKSRTCPHCRVRMEMLTEDEDDARLDRGQQTEEQIGAIDYKVFVCATCKFERTLRVVRWFSGYSACGNCSYKTLRKQTVTLTPATTDSEGLQEVSEHCAHCSYQNTYTRTIPRLPPPSTESSSSYDSGYNSGYDSSYDSGYSGGSDFGGGSSGGGGAGSSW